MILWGGMTMNKKTVFYSISIISFLASMYFIIQMPDIVPTHWNSAGEIDGYGSKWLNVFLAIMPIVVYFGMGFTRKIDPKKDKIDKRSDVYEMFRYFLGYIFIVINWMIIASILNKELPFTLLISLTIGIMLIIMGNYCPRIPQNYFLGFKLPWAIENEQVWYRTQRMGGIAMIVSGIVTIMAGFIKTDWSYMIMTSVLIISLIVATVDSYLYYKKVTNSK